MDGFLNPFLSSSLSWADTGASGRSSWVGDTASQTNSLLSSPMGVYGHDDKNLNMCMVPTNHVVENLATHQANIHLHDGASSIIFGGNLKYDLKRFPGESKIQQDPSCITVPSEHESKVHERGFSLQEVIDSYSTAGSIGPELNITLPHSALTESGSVESNDSEPSVFTQSLGDSCSISTIPQLWTSSCLGVPSLGIGPGSLEGFGLQRELMGSDDDVLEKTHIKDDRLPQLDSFSASEFNELQNPHLSSFPAGVQLKLAGSAGLLPCHQEQDELQSPHLPFTSGSQRIFTSTVGLQTHQQLSQSSEEINCYTNNPRTPQQPASANANGSNGVVKPRVRARRGQATDPHSIAERLRREKIAERMKNLQELVPNSNKTDKASMLDEIIDYVKFLQLQVKVLSMSRLGAAGAVVPLITDVHAEGSSGLLLSSSIGQSDLADSQDNLNLAFEQEVVKLMESNVTMAMQYLQNKGLCLMPIALASAISGRKGSCGSIPLERAKPGTNQGVSVTPQYCESMMKEWNGRVDASNCNGAGVKPEESQKSASNARELKPKA